MENLRPQVGVGVIIRKGSKILLGKRKNVHGAGSWCPPGGHLEFGESIKKCALREVQEEVGIKISNLKLLTITNDYFKKENKHYITIHLAADYTGGKVKLMEPNKCSGWKWFEKDKLPQSLMLPIKNLIKRKVKL